MVFPVVGGDGKPTGYEISNSLRFNDDDSARLNRTFATPTNRKKFTFSAWYKRSTLSTTQYIISYDSGGTPMGIIGFSSADKFIIYDRDSSSGAADIDYNTTQLFRDVSAWYHIVVSIDTTDGTSGDRVKIYVNGTRITSFDVSTAPAQDYDTIMNSAVSHDIGRWQAGSSYYDGYMSEINYVDGQALDPTYFGETNDNGVWIPKEYDGSYGTNGFYLEFKQTGTSANSSGIGADTSGNDNHFTPTNLAARDVAVDTPTNNFATLIPALNMALSEGNVKAMTTRTGNWDAVHSSIGVTSGKWYFEVKASTSGTFRVKGGIVGNPETFTFLYNGLGGSGDPLSSLSNTYPAYGKGVWLSHWYDQNYNSSSTASSQSSGDILQFALDLDNYKLWVGINGQFKDNSNNNVSYSDVASGNSATVTIASAAYTGKTFFPDVWLRDDAGSDDNIAEINFGNPSFSISSGNSDGKYGNFEYAPPSGYYALCTKRLAEFG